MRDGWRERLKARADAQREVRAAAMRPAVPGEPRAVRSQRTYNALRRSNTRLGTWQQICLTGVLGAVFALFSLSWPVILLCIAWIVLAGWVVPRRLQSAELRLDAAWASADRADLKAAAKLATLWAALNLVAVAGGLVVIAVVATALR